MRPIQSIISIAGFDPSGGAGVLADIKTFEQIGVYGCGIATGITYQNDVKFYGGHWLGFNEISAQFKPLQERFQFDYAKIGMVDSADVLNRTIKMLLKHNPDIKIIWDPVMQTSSGVLIHENDFVEEISETINNLYLITPNFEEAKQLGLIALKDDRTFDFSLASLRLCVSPFSRKDAKTQSLQNEGPVSPPNILVTGAQTEESLITDVLYSDDRVIRFDAEKIENAEKHGSGCVLSAAITAFLSLGVGLEESCGKAKEYTLHFLLSTPGLLGFHHSIYTNEPNAS